MSDRKHDLLKIFESVDESQRVLIDNLIDELVFQESRLQALRKLPFIRVHPKNPARQETTPAQRQYKEISQSYTNIVRVLLSVLNKSEGDDYDPVAEFLETLKNEPK